MASLDNLARVKADVWFSGHGDPWTGGVPEAIRLAKATGPSRAPPRPLIRTPMAHRAFC